MRSKTVAIVGARSTSAIHLGRLLELKGIKVFRFSSDPRLGTEFNYDINSQAHNIFNFEFTTAVYFAWSINRDLDSQRKAADAAVKFACDAKDRNIDVIFISSLASLPNNSKSFYGVCKREAEIAMRNNGHSIVRPATVISSSDKSFSKSLDHLIRLRSVVRVFTFFSKRLYVPTVDVAFLSESILGMIENPIITEIDLIQNIEAIETIIDIPRAKLYIPISWAFIAYFKNRGQALDRLLTLISVSDWIKENQDQLESTMEEPI